MFPSTICIVGIDKRFDYLAIYLKEQGFLISRHDTFSPEAIVGVDLLIGPFTMYTKGKLLPEIEAACTKERVPILNYMASEDFLVKNAALTAEGFLSYLIKETPFSLSEAHILLLGLGRCGKALSKLLNLLCPHVDAIDMVPDILPHSNYNVVINTIPAPVISKDTLLDLKPDCILFDISSAPGGFDLEAVAELGLTRIACPQIPGKTCPQSAGIAIGEAAISYLN